jgi:hypothetical protein
MTVMEKAPQAAADTNTNRTAQAASR